jgi:hypothetical protein
MVEKLRSTSKRIHWFLVLRALIFGLAWAWFPFWLFIPVALYLYFVPLFQARKLLGPFVVLLLLTYLQAPGILFAAIFAALFYVLLLIKDLLLIDRRSTYELLALTLSFFMLRAFYAMSHDGVAVVSVWYAFLVAAVLTLLMRSFLRFFREEFPHDERALMAATWLSFLLFVQLIIAGLFLPLDFIYQAVLVFIPAILLMDLVPAHFFGDLTRTKLLTTASAVFVLFAVVLSSARWGL